jgi:aspartate aminotransferase-like enzyme
MPFTMHHHTNLRIPGPTPIPPEVLDVMSRQMINHRGSEYGAIQHEVLENLRHFFQTEQDVLLFTGSGTGGLEAAIVNTLSPGDRVLSVPMGVFGERFARIATAYGVDVRRLEVPWGSAAQPDTLEQALAEMHDCRAVLLTCNETSTGVMNDMAALIEVVRRLAPPPPLLLVDAVSALGAVDLPMDQLGIDVMITGSQKAWMAPPGITMLGVSSRAWEYHSRARLPHFYWDFTTQRNAQSKHMDAWTPAVTTMFALHRALALMCAEGRDNTFARHKRIAAYTRQRLRATGLSLFADPGSESPTVTSARVPEGIDGKALLRQAMDQYGVVLGDGQDKLAGRILRIGHMGWVTEPDIDDAVAAIEQSLASMGATVRPVSGTRAEQCLANARAE